MKAELQKKIYEKYPKIFGQKDLPMTDTCMCWGIECGDGWYWLLDMLCQAVQDHVESRQDGSKDSHQVEAVQVKEKFGGLRFYVNSADAEVYGMISLAEQMSYNICEKCGSTENIQRTKGGWITYLCPKCLKESGRNAEVVDENEIKEEEEV